MKEQVSMVCRYCGEAFTRERKWSTQRLAEVCAQATCRTASRADAGRKGGQSTPVWRRAAARKAAWDRVRRAA